MSSVLDVFLKVAGIVAMLACCAFIATVARILAATDDQPLDEHREWA